MTAAADTIIAQYQRLSESLLWQWQRAFFAEQGVGAWRQVTVPYYITSNPDIAQAYGQVAQYIYGGLSQC